MRKLLGTFLLMTIFVYGNGYAQPNPAPEANSAQSDTAQKEADDRRAKLRALNWIRGPATVSVGSNSKLTIPEHYIFLDPANTTKFNAIAKNLGDGQESMIAPDDFTWTAFLEFSDAGYVKDNDKMDAAAMLSSLKDTTEKSNAERQRLGYPLLHILNWASPPAYNSSTKRLEWATLLRDANNQDVANFFTKILGRRGYTSVVMASDPADLQSAEASLNSALNGYSFDAGETYAEWRPGDKVAEYGLAALIVGGAAAVAAKKGLFGVIAGFLAVAWKFVVAAAVAALAWVRSLFKKKA
jgi:uncharacterized membrane-anchored protein